MALLDQICTEVPSLFHQKVRVRARLQPLDVVHEVLQEGMGETTSLPTVRGPAMGAERLGLALPAQSAQRSGPLRSFLEDEFQGPGKPHSLTVVVPYLHLVFDKAAPEAPVHPGPARFPLRFERTRIYVNDPTARAQSWPPLGQQVFGHAIQNRLCLLRAVLCMNVSNGFLAVAENRLDVVALLDVLPAARGPRRIIGPTLLGALEEGDEGIHGSHFKAGLAWADRLGTCTYAPVCA